MPDTTVVLTSCNRHDLLARTLESFRQYNTDRGVARIIVVEDGDGDPSSVCKRFDAELIRTGTRVGQMAAIDRAYAEVQTPYIFHLEDDWEFFRPGFIERSRRILEADPSTLIVWLRAWDDTNGHPLTFKSEDRTFGVMSTNFEDVFHGFTFNSGLRRLADYRSLGCYSKQPITINFGHRQPSIGLQLEAEVSKFYFLRGFRSVILDESGYVRHIGWGRHISHPDDAKLGQVAAAGRAGPAGAPAATIATAPRDDLCPCGSGKRYKDCHGKW